MKDKIDVILHPVRMRILQTLLRGEQLTVQQMRKILHDIAVPTLYRHLQTLVDKEIIQVVEERQVRGTVEKTYALPTEHIFSKAEIEKASAKEHIDYFMTFMLSVLSQFSQYIGSEQADMMENLVSYRQIQLQLTEEELMDILQVMRKVMLRHLDNEPTDNRNLYAITTIIIPLLSRGTQDI